MDRGRRRRLLDGPPRRLTRPFPQGLYAPDRVNVTDQRHDPTSFWWFIRKLIYRYRQLPQIGWSTVEVLRHANPAVLAHVCRELSGWSMVGLHNFGADRTMVQVDLGETPEGTMLTDLLEDRPPVPLGRDGTVDLDLEGYGFRWLRVLRPDDRPLI